MSVYKCLSALNPSDYIPIHNINALNSEEIGCQWIPTGQGMGIGGSSNVFINGFPAMRAGDKFATCVLAGYCPGVGKTHQSDIGPENASTNVMCDGLGMAINKEFINCGDNGVYVEIMGGATNVLATFSA